MKVLLFAQARAAAGTDLCEVKLPVAVISSGFWSVLLKQCPALAPFEKTSRLARNGTYLQGDELIDPNDEIAVIPPVSGG